LVGIYRKNPKNFRPEYCFHVPAIMFQRFPVLSCRIR
jgi:hypothetical protein